MKVEIFLLILSIIPTIIRSNNLPRAQTEQGIYIGRQTTLNSINVNYWYGIPYAQQPLDNLRWMPPQALTPSNGIHIVDTPNACPQAWDFPFLHTEACLTLNIHAPENAHNLPVYVWIHGGAFTQGAGILYNGNALVSTTKIKSIPVIVVTINYRLGLLGYLADKALYDERSGINNRSTTGNYGMLDQIMALDWIKKNIHGFGGDPEQITIGGESAGGVSVAILYTSSLVMNGTFQRGIIQSGGIWPNIVATLEDVIPSYARGNFQKLPILIGVNTNETSLFTCPLFNGSANVAQVQTYLTTLYNSTIINKLPSIYGSISNYVTPLNYLNTIYSDSWAHCGSRRMISKFSSYGLSSYFYTYDHIIPVAPPCSGVPHCAELIMFFPSIIPYLYPKYKFTRAEEELSTNMILYWANFIYTSNPNHRGSPANWDPYLTTSDNDFVLNINAGMRHDYYNNTCSGFWDLYAVTNNTFFLIFIQILSQYKHALHFLFSTLVLKN